MSSSQSRWSERGHGEARWRPAGDGRAVTTAFRANVPQLYVDVNRTECMTKDVDLQDLFDTLRIYLGSLYVNDFNRFGRTWQVIVQADAQFRNQVEDVQRLKVRNAERHDGPARRAGRRPRESTARWS